MAHTIKTLLRAAKDKLPYIRSLRAYVDNAGAFPPGHYYSPTPSREEVERAITRARAEAGRKGVPPGIALNEEKQFELLRIFATFYDDLPFPEEPSPCCRFYFRGSSPFPYPDAIFLYSFLRYAQPKQIVEVGSGFSSAVILDTVDRFFPERPKITFIQPYPINLNSLLRPDDHNKVTVHVEKVQNIPLDSFAALNAGDFLFIDSSHVVKCGSDVHFLLFEVLPRLPVGVYVHFHDVFRSFEYPEYFLSSGWYWNEGYFLRAFLSNNNAWAIRFFNNYIRVAAEDFLKEKMPLCVKNIGGSLYIQRTAEDLFTS